jgi:glycosyltransferase involved in cell wall biosynthesis
MRLGICTPRLTHVSNIKLIEQFKRAPNTDVLLYHSKNETLMEQIMLNAIPNRYSEKLRDFLIGGNISSLMNKSDIVLFDWSERNLAIGSKLKTTQKIATRLHRYEIFFDYFHEINWQNVDAINLVNKALQKRFVNHYPALVDRTVVIYDALDTETYKPQPDKEFHGTIGMVGYIVERKRVYDFIISFSELIKEYPDLSFRIAGKGEGEYFTMLQELVEKLGIKNKVVFDGYVEDLAAWYNNIDLIVCNSYHESFHMGLHDGTLCGCYPLSHFWDGVDEFLPEYFVFSSNEDLTNKITEWYNLSDTKRYSRIKAQQEQLVTNHNVKTISEQILNMLRKCIE